MKLKPCPFCGSKDIGLNDAVDMPNSHYWAEVVCGNCCRRTSSYKTATEAITAWNKQNKVEVLSVEIIKQKIEKELLSKSWDTDKGDIVMPRSQAEEIGEKVAAAIHKELIKGEEDTIMGDWADDAMDGACCQVCGQYLGEDCGYPRTCEGCKDDTDHAITGE